MTVLLRSAKQGFLGVLIMAVLISSVGTALTAAPPDQVKQVSGADPMKWILPISDAWKGYQQYYIFCGEDCGDNMGLVFDPGAGFVAVSEGVGYGLLMAVMMNDQLVFNKIYEAAHRIMLDFDTGLFHWRVDNQGNITGSSSATDSELDIAAALIFAQARVDAGEWEQHEGLPYGPRAAGLLDSIWTYEVVEGRYLLPGDRFGGEGREIINLSYFAPAWFRLYNQFEQTDRWTPLIDQGYRSLYSTPGADLGLAPDWSTADGDPAYEYCDRVERPRGICRYEMFYDAIRVPWRIGLDCLWNNEPRACEWSVRSMNFLRTLPDNQFARMYDMQGNPIVEYQDVAMVSMWTVAAYAAQDREIFNRLEQTFYAMGSNLREGGYWGPSPEFYFNQSLAWFGASILAGNFRDLTKE